MQVIIVGGGKIGVSLAETLSAHKHDVIIIEEDRRKCQEIADDFNGVVINGDATDVDVLKDAKIETADVFAAVTSDEEVNLLSCLLAKENSKAKTLARVTNHGYENIFRKVGIDLVLSPEEAFASRLESIIIEQNVMDVAMIQRGLIDVKEFKVTEKSGARGKTINDLEHPKGAIIAAVKYGGEWIIPETHKTLKANDKVLVIAKKQLEKQVRKMFE